jgi:hypothetical protein
MLKKVILCLIIASFCFSLLAYDTGKSPSKAALYSFLIPGGGQYYNESTWKSILWGGSELGFIALTSYHHNKFLDYKDKRNNASNQEEWAKWNKEAGDQLHKRNNGFWWLGSTLILSMMDAYVDAALFDFAEEKQKLELQFNLNYLGLQFNF